MKKNIYTDAVSKISTPDEVLQKGLESIRGAETTNEVINFKEAKANRKWFKPIGAVAAALAVIIGINAVGTFREKEGNTVVSNPFMITAYAQELNTESYVKIGDIKMNDGYLEYTIDDDGNERINQVIPVFEFDVVCEGEGIKDITYSTTTGKFLVNDRDEAVLDYSELTKEDEEKFGRFTVNERKSASSCVLASNDKATASTPLFITFKIQDAKEMYEADMQKYGGGVTGNDIDAMAEALFNDSEYTYNADITANFTDGSKITHTLEFKCDHDENGYFLAAKIVE